MDMLAFYRIVAGWRNEYPVLRTGTFKVLVANDGQRIVAFERRDATMQAVAIFNAGDAAREVGWATLGMDASGRWRCVAGRKPEKEAISVDGRGYTFLVRARR
jgi:hypothetical protein